MKNVSTLICHRLALFFAALLAGLSISSESQSQGSSSAANPVRMSYSTERARAVSPNGKLEVIVTGDRQPLKAWVTINDLTGGMPVQVWPIERSVTVLWQPDSHAIALTDNRYANASYVLIIGTNFNVSGSQLGVFRQDLTPLIRQNFSGLIQKYYNQNFGVRQYDASYALYTKALRWVSNDQLLIGVSAVTSLPMAPNKLGSAEGVKGWLFAYLVDVRNGRVIRSLDEKNVKETYGISLSKMAMND